VISSVPVTALVLGTDGSDRIEIKQVGDTLYLDVNGERSQITGVTGLSIDALEGKDFITLTSVTMDVSFDAGAGKDIIRTRDVTESVMVDGGDGKELLIKRSGDDFDHVDAGKVMITRAAMASADSLKSVTEKLKSLTDQISDKHGWDDRHDRNQSDRHEQEFSKREDKFKWSIDRDEWTFGKRGDDNGRGDDDGDRETKHSDKTAIDWNDDAFARSSLKSGRGDTHIPDFSKGPHMPTPKNRGK
jgi:hypothetical protein